MRVATLLLSLALSIPALPVAAQVSERPGYGWNGYGHMWEGWMYPGMGMLVAVFCLLALIGIVALVVWMAGGLFHRQSQGPGAHGRWALDILAERFARGEINKDEFEDKRRVIGR